MSVRLRDRLRTRGAAGGSGAVSSYLPSLAHWWKLDEASGTRVDSIYAAAPQASLTQVGTVGQGTGKLGPCASFTTDADSNYLYAEVASQSIGYYVNSGPWTLSAWVKTPASPLSHDQVPLAEGLETDPDQTVWRAQFLTGWSWRIVGTGVGNIMTMVSPAIIGSTWYLVTVRRLQSRRISLNLWNPGVSDATATTPNPCDPNAYHRFSVGAGGGGTLRCFGFLIDNILWWPGELDDYYVRGVQGV